MIQTENKFYNHAMQSLIDNTKRRKALESNFDRNRLKEYEQICSAQLSCCVELLKLGVESRLDEGNVIIPTDEETGPVSFPEDEVKELLGDEAFYVLFPKQEEVPDDEDDEDDLLEDEKEVEIEHNEQPLWNSFNPFTMFLPFFQMAQQPMQYINQPQQQKQMLDNPLQAVQDELEHLKSEKKKLKKIARKYKAEAEELKNQIPDYVYNNGSEEIKLLTENNTSLTEQIEDLKYDIKLAEDEKADLKQQVDKVKADAEAEKEDLRSEIAHARIKFDNALTEAVKNEAAKAKKEISELKLSLHKVTKERDEKSNLYDSKISSLTKSNEMLKNDYKEISDKLNACRTEKDNAISEKDDLIFKVSDLQNKIDTLTKDAAQNNSQLSKLSEMQSEKKKLLSELSDCKKSIEKAEIEKRAYIDQLAEIKKQLEVTKAENNKPKANIQKHYDDVLQIRVFSDLINELAMNNAKTISVVTVPLFEYFLTTYDKDVQNASISKVATALIKNFGKDNVYICGQKQFAIITNTLVNKELAKIHDSLSELDLEIVWSSLNVKRSASFTFSIALSKADNKANEYLEQFYENNNSVKNDDVSDNDDNDYEVEDDSDDDAEYIYDAEEDDVAIAESHESTIAEEYSDYEDDDEPALSIDESDSTLYNMAAQFLNTPD